MVRPLYATAIHALLLVACALGSSSCAKNDELKVIDAVDSALYHLSQATPACQEAIDVLEGVGRQPENSRYLQTLASAYACRGNFSELTLFGEIDTISADQYFLGSLAKLSSSEQAEAESDDFDDLQTAIDILLYAGGKATPSATEQQTVFGARQGGNLNLQALYMMIAQLGRYARWYGNGDADGDKGDGGAANVCFFDYSTTGAPAPNTIATAHGGSNACTGTNNGHADLDYIIAGQAVAQRRLCQGLMLFNNIYDVLQNTTISSDSSLGALGDVVDALEPYIITAEAYPGVAALIATLSQEDCETALAASDTAAQYIFAALFEGGMP